MSQAPQHAPDVVVVGGGVLGHAIARELTRAAMNVLLVYPRDHGRDSATLAAGAMIGAFGELTCDQTGVTDRQKLEFRIAAQERYRTWLDDLRAESGRDVFTTDGMVMIANNGGRQDRFHLRRIKAELDAYGKKNEWIEPTDVPYLRPHDEYQAYQALFIHDDLTVDSAQLLAALAQTVTARRGHVLHDRVIAIDAAAEQWSVTTLAHGVIRTAQVVVCAGARVAAALGEQTLAELHLPVLYFAKGLGCIVSGAPAFPHAIRTPNRSDACGYHVVPRAERRLYIGASNHYGYATAAARGITPGEVTAILGGATREINRSLRDTTIETLRFGLRPVCRDDAPLVGRTVLPGLFLATATFRTGIVMAPLIAQVVTAEALGHESPVANPFAATAERCRISDPTCDLNVANLYANRGLYYYNRLQRGGDRADAEQALAAWRAYTSRAGVHADRRIIALMARLDHEQDDERIW